jgi:hypothetical protein
MISAYEIMSEEKATTPEDREDWQYAIDFVRLQLSGDDGEL